MSRYAGVDLHLGRPWLLLAGLLVLHAPAAAQGTGSREEAVRTWKLQAQAGDRDANFALGIAYDLGQGAVRDARLACLYYRAAGDRGHVSGAFNTAVMYDSGQCEDGRRADLAATWYGRAAAAGTGRAQFNLALLYGSGEGVPRNPAVAAAWFRAAAASGIPAASRRGGNVARPETSKDPLLPVIPTFPGPAQSILRDDAATLVWMAPEQADTVQFFVEVYALRPSGPEEVVGRYVEVTAVQISLPADATEFTWRVLTVCADPPRYTVGPWRDFTTAQAAPKQK